MVRQRVGVLFGGWGEEKSVSIKSGVEVATALERQGHEVIRIMAGPRLDEALRAANVDVVFNALHGRMGEDGRVQGLLDLLGIPYTGSGVLPSAMAMNKVVAKRIFQVHNLEVPMGYSLEARDVARVRDWHVDLGFPCLVKPACGGSSFGVSLANSLEQLEARVAEAVRFGGTALVERFVRGKEVTVAVVGDEVLGSLEITSPNGVFDVDAKYVGGSTHHLPPRLPTTRLRNVETMALKAYRALGCRGAARVDLICADKGNDVILEVNTQPGMTPKSLLPKIAAHAGVSFEALVERLLSLAACDGAAEDVEVAPAFEPVRAARTG